MRIWILLAITLMACQKKDPVVFPKPDASTYFPLIPGSYWVYEDFHNGRRVDDTREVDSVLSITETDSGLVAVVVENRIGSAKHQVQYRIDAKGLVWSKRSGEEKFTPYTSLNPADGQEIGSNTVFKSCSDGSPPSPDCVLLQPYRNDDPTLSDEQSADWTGLFFKKGIGLESDAGNDISTGLMEYRIGPDGPVVMTGKVGDGTPEDESPQVGCSVPREGEVDCPSLSPDLDGDKVPDTLQLVHLSDSFQASGATRVANPFGKSALALPEAIAVLINLSGEPDVEYVLHDSAYFSTPIWDDSSGRLKGLSVIPKGPGSFPETDDEIVPKAKGDRVVFPTEAGSNTYLYFTDQGFQLYWTQEEP